MDIYLVAETYSRSGRVHEFFSKIDGFFDFKHGLNFYTLRTLNYSLALSIEKDKNNHPLPEKFHLSLSRSSAIIDRFDKEYTEAIGHFKVPKE